MTRAMNGNGHSSSNGHANGHSNGHSSSSNGNSANGDASSSSSAATRPPLRVAVVGGGISGIAAASYLFEQSVKEDGVPVKVTLFDPASHLGGHAYTQYVPIPSTTEGSASPSLLAVDTGFMVCNAVTYPNMLAWFERYQVEMEKSDMSLSVSYAAPKSNAASSASSSSSAAATAAVERVNGIEWSSDGLAGIFAQKRRLMDPFFALMISDVLRFKTDVLAFLDTVEANSSSSSAQTVLTLGEFLIKHRYSSYFIRYYLMPVCASVWSCPQSDTLNFPAPFLFRFLKNHHLLQLINRPQWLTVANRSQSGYVQKVTADWPQGTVKLQTSVERCVVHPLTGVATLTLVERKTSSNKKKEHDEQPGQAEQREGQEELQEEGEETRSFTREFDAVIFATHAPDTLRILGQAATAAERELLSSIRYQNNEVVLHTDSSFMPQRRSCWASWNFLGDDQRASASSASSSSAASASAVPAAAPALSSVSISPAPVVLTYYLNRLQNLPSTAPNVFVTLNPTRPIAPSCLVSRTWMSHPTPTLQATEALKSLPAVQGARALFFAGAWTGYGFHEDGFKSGQEAAFLLCQKEKGIRASLAASSATSASLSPPLKEMNKLHESLSVDSLSPSSRKVEQNGNGHIESLDKVSLNGHANTKHDAVSICAAASNSTSVVPSSYIPLANPPSFNELMPLMSVASISRFLVLRFLSQFVQKGRVTLKEVGGSVETFGSSSCSSSSSFLTQPHATLIVHRPEFYIKIAARADLGLADAYIDGDFTAASDAFLTTASSSSSSSRPQQDSLLTFLQVLVLNRDENQAQNSNKLNLSGLFLSSLQTGFTFLLHNWWKRNTPAQSRLNISEHYDTGNDFFALFLDRTLTYSCAIFQSPQDSLEKAQEQKVQRLVEKLRLKAGMSVLEIGSGWGYLSRFVASKYGCHVTSITLSSEQLQLCRELAQQEGLSSLVAYELIDYRVFGLREQRKFDRIVSCEMLEAVGHEFFPDFYRHCDRLLKPDGLMSVQVIAFPDSKYDEYRLNIDFIREQIFPGGLCPSLTALMTAMTSSSNLMLEAVENIGPHYTRTLGMWRENLKRADPAEIARLKLTPAVLRKWDYYFVYCQAGFLSRSLAVYHLLYTKPSNGTLDGDFDWWNGSTLPDSSSSAPSSSCSSASSSSS